MFDTTLYSEGHETDKTPCQGAALGTVLWEFWQQSSQTTQMGAGDPGLEAQRDHSLLEKSPVHSIPISRPGTGPRDNRCIALGSQSCSSQQVFKTFSGLGHKVLSWACYLNQVPLVPQLMVRFHQVFRGNRARKLTQCQLVLKGERSLEHLS